MISGPSHTVCSAATGCTIFLTDDLDSHQRLFEAAICLSRSFENALTSAWAGALKGLPHCTHTVVHTILSLPPRRHPWPVIEICAIDVEHNWHWNSAFPNLYLANWKILICWGALQKVCCHAASCPCTCEMQVLTPAKRMSAISLRRTFSTGRINSSKTCSPSPSVCMLIISMSPLLMKASSRSRSF